jgi:hypothetical protein
MIDAAAQELLEAIETRQVALAMKLYFVACFLACRDK